MTDNYRRERITRRIEHVVPASEPWGATFKDMQLAMHHAIEEIKERGGRTDCDDVLRFQARDDEIVVYYEVEQVER